MSTSCSAPSSGRRRAGRSRRRAGAARRRRRPRRRSRSKTGVVLGVTGASLDGRAGHDLGADGPVGLGQVDAAARRQRPQPGDARPCAGARRGRLEGHRRLPRGRAAPHPPHTAWRWCSSSSACCRGARCARMSPSGSSCAARRATEIAPHRRRAAGAGRARRLGGSLCRRAVGRHAAARRPRPRLRHRRRHPADGRALLRARSADPRQAAGRAARSAGEGAEDDPVRQPRSRRGAEARRPRDARWKAAASSRAARRRTSCCARRRPMSPSSCAT